MKRNILLNVNTKLALIAFAFVPVMAFFAYHFNRLMKRAFKRRRETIGVINSQLEDSLAGIRVVKSFANENIEMEKFEDGNKGFVEAKRMSYQYMAGYHSGLSALTTLVTVAVLLGGVAFLSNGSIEVIDLITFLLYINNFIEPVKKLMNFTETFQNGYAGFERFMEIMDVQPDITDAEDAVSLYRRLLATANSPVEIIEIGFLQAFAKLLESNADEISPLNGIELVKEKVKKVWVMAGKWDENNGIEHNFANNERSRHGGAVFCQKCPVPITFLGFEIGCDVITGDNLDENDHLYKTMCKQGSSHGRFSWDPMTALLAVIGDEEKAGYDTVCGKAFVDELTGANSFTVCAEGKHKYVIKKFDNDYYKTMINNIIK